MVTTLKDIAKKTKVTPIVVSYVLNDRQGPVRVSDPKRLEIKKAAKEMDYVPNLKARAMSTSRSYTIGLIWSYPEVTNNPEHMVSIDGYVSTILRGVENICSGEGYHCLFSYCDLTDLETFVHPRAMKDGSVDGVILLGYTSDEVVSKLATMNIPCVQVGSNVSSECSIERIYADLDGGFEQAVRYLAALEHRRVHLFMPGGPGPKLHAENFRKLNNCIKGVETEAVVGTSLEADDTYGRSHAEKMLKEGEIPTAIITDPRSAMGISRAFAEKGYECPRDYSMMCYCSNIDKRNIYCRNVEPPISMISWDGVEIGRLAARRLLALLDVIKLSKDETKQTTVPCKLITGGSSGPCRRADIDSSNTNYDIVGFQNHRKAFSVRSVE